MRLGIRAQLLLSIAALLLLALAPLFFAVASLARASFARVWQEDAEALGRSIAGRVSEARAHRSPAGVASLLEAQVGRGVVAIGIYDASGALSSQAGDGPLPDAVAPARAEVRGVDLDGDDGILVVVPGAAGPVATLMVPDPSVVRVGPLVQSVALYIGLLGSALLVVVYFVLTRLVVSPLVQLAQAAEGVAAGGRKLSVPRRGGHELLTLGSSLATMTAALRAEEEKLRDHVAELEQTTHDLRLAQDTVVRSERLASVGRLAAGLAHEIGNPIAAILSFQELLLDGELDDEQRDFLERMKRETERVNRILRDLLDFARPTAQAQRDDLTASASVAEVIEHVCALVRPQKSFKSIELGVAVDEGLPPVGMHAGRVEQVLLNLLLNAADVVPADAGRIEVAARRDADAVEVTVEDNGGGVDDAIVDELFEPFVTTKDVGDGTGLGLAVCRGLVEAAGGSIELEDGESGARFVVRLPVLGRPSVKPPSDRPA